MDRQLQAIEVNQRMANQLHGIAQEKSAYTATLQQQQSAQMQSDANRRLIELRQSTEMARSSVTTEKANCIDVATKRRNSAMLAECKGIPRVQAQNELDEPLTDSQLLPIQDNPIPVVKSCNGNSCRDQYGDRYQPTVVPGTFDRSDGKRWYQRGKVMYCD